MAMRVEFHAALWIAAAAASAWSAISVLALTSTAPSLLEPPVAGARQTTPLPGDPTVRPELPVFDADVRPLFAVSERPIPAPATPDSVAAANVVAPDLKGIIGRGGEDPRAVFSRADSGAAYIVAGQGDAIGEFRVLRIGADGLALRSPDGSETTIRLRGSGETP